MAPEKEDTSYIWDMLDAAKAVREFITGRSYQDYVIDRMLRVMRRWGDQTEKLILHLTDNVKLPAHPVRTGHGTLRSRMVLLVSP